MSYKRKFKPLELLIDNRWVEDFEYLATAIE
jgi:arginyl-tRNA--protein-N-Asp/Glu arginylyltransferase